MTPTKQLRERLRKLLNETIPDDGDEKDTNFTDEEIDELLTEADNIFVAASVGWTMKAGMLQSEIQKYGVGDENYDITPLRDRLNHALVMAEHYKGMSEGESGGSFILRSEPPKVI